MSQVAASIPADATDEEWREAKFSAEQITGAKNVSRSRGGKVPTFKQLKGALEAYGADGILESATLLSRADYEALEKLVRKTPAPKLPARRKARR